MSRTGILHQENSHAYSTFTVSVVDSSNVLAGPRNFRYISIEHLLAMYAAGMRKASVKLAEPWNADASKERAPVEIKAR